MADESREVAERAAGVLGPESDLFEDLDAAGFGDALSQALRSSLGDPALPAQARGGATTPRELAPEPARTDHSR